MPTRPRPASDPHALKHAATDHAAAVLDLVDLARTASAFQYSAPPRAHREPNDVASRPSSIPRPVEDLVSDPRRLALRAGYLGASDALTRATADLRVATARLSAVLQPYNA